MKKKIFKLLLVFLMLFSVQTFAQQNITINQGGTVTVSDGDMFYDAGGSSGTDGNANYTITLCPMNSGDRICLDFSMFNTYYNSSAGKGDSLCIFDGNSTSGTKIATLMGNYGGDFGSGSNVGWTASGNMPTVTTPTIFCSTTGCLTMTFSGTYNAALNPGWAATIKTYTPLGTPGCNIDLTADKTTICNGESVLLTATGKIVAAAINNNFNNSSVGTGWQGTSSATFQSNACGSTSPDGSTYLWMANAACPRTLTSNGMDVLNGGTVSYQYRQASLNGATSPCEAPDLNMSGSTPESVLLQYSTDGGTNWVTMKVMFAYDYGCATCDGYVGTGYMNTLWRDIVVPIPTAAKTANTMFRWYMPLCTSASTDNWGLDNVVISSPKPSTITIKDMTASGTPTIGTSTTSPYSVSVTPTVTTTYQVTISDGTNSCTDNIIITVNSCGCTAPTIDAQPVNKTICVGGNTTFNVTASGTANGYQWQVNTGSGFTNVSNGGVYSGATTNTLTITGGTLTMNNYTYKCIVTEAVGTCPSTTSIVTLIINSVTPEAGVSPGDITCSNPTRQLSASGGGSYSWSGGSITSGSNTATPTINAVGTYVVTVTNNGCSGVDNVIVGSNTTPPTVTLTEPTILTCTNTSTTLTAGGGGTYNWSNSLGTNATLTITTSGTYSVTVTDPSNGCSASSSKIVTSNTTPPTSNAGSDKILTCSNPTVTLDGSLSSTGTYNWSGTLVSGQGTLSPVVNQSGTYILVVTNPTNGCTASDNVVVTTDNSMPTSSITSTDLDICIGENVTLTSSVGTTYNWSDGLGTNQTASVSPTSTHTYSVTITNTQGCSNNSSITITVYQKPIVNVSNQSICIGSSVTLTATGDAGTYLWNPTGETTQSITVTPTTTSTYIVTVTANGCSASEDAVVSVSPSPPVNFTSDKINGCEHLDVQFTSTNLLGTLLWNFGDGTTSTINPTTHTYSAGTYNVSLSITENGCTSTLTNNGMITVFTNPIADFSWSGIDNNISFLSTSTNSTKWLWNFGDNSTSNVENISHMYLNAGDYLVTLNVENNNGCKDDISKTISIKDISTFFMPNAFSPNSDLKNEIYGPVFYNLEFKEFKYFIYNRWGGLIFETTNPEQKWDGKMMGNMVQDGVYVWRIDYTEKGGKLITRYGTVTLIK